MSESCQKRQGCVLVNSLNKSVVRILRNHQFCTRHDIFTLQLPCPKSQKIVGLGFPCAPNKPSSPEIFTAFLPPPPLCWQSPFSRWLLPLLQLLLELFELGLRDVVCFVFHLKVKSNTRVKCGMNITDTHVQKCVQFSRGRLRPRYLCLKCCSFLGRARL